MDSDDADDNLPKRRKTKEKLSIQQYESLRQSEQDRLIFNITDDMGSDSECGGDSEADDYLDLSRRPSSTPIKSSSLQDVPSTSTQGVLPSRTRGKPLIIPAPTYGVSDEDSDIADDSDADPDFNPERKTPPFLGRLFDSLSDVSDEETNEDGNGNVGPNDLGNQQSVLPNVPPPPFNFSKNRPEPKTFNNFVFDQPMGTKVTVDFSSPLAIFLCIIGPFLNTIVDQSNLFAQQHRTELSLTKDELLAFIGLLVIMGYHVLPSMRHYWNSDPTFHVEAVSKVMSLRRFLLILRYLHLNDNSKMPMRGHAAYDRLYKMRPMIDFLKTRYKELFNPSRFLSIDESMIGFKGRSSLKQYLPNKPTKRGFKVWVICCAVTGFMLGFDVYEGKNTVRDKEETLGEHVVMGLATAFQNLGYCIYFDRFFSNLPLVKRLLSKSLFGCGTIQSDRKYFPKNLLKKDNKLQTGQSDFAADGEISVTKWKDRGRKSVQIVSNMHDPEEFGNVDRKNIHGEKISIKCPKAVADYNRYMGGVDHFDHMQSCYSIIQKSRRWWLKIFYFFLDSVIVNAYILYKYVNNSKREKPISNLKFRMILAKELIGDFKGRRTSKVGWTAGKKTGGNTVVNIDNKELGLHLPVPTSCRRCARCSTKKNTKRSSIECEKCKVALCLGCFAPFHKGTI